MIFPRNLAAEKNLSFKQVAIYAVMTDLSSKSRSTTFEQPAKDRETIHGNVKDLFVKFLSETPLEVRRVGVKVSGFSREEPQQKQLTHFSKPAINLSKLFSSVNSF